MLKKSIKINAAKIQESLESCKVFEKDHYDHMIMTMQTKSSVPRYRTIISETSSSHYVVTFLANNHPKNSIFQASTQKDL